MRRTDRLTRILAAPCHLAAGIGMALYPLLIFTVLYDVITRKLPTYFPGLAGTPFFQVSTALQELEWHLHSAIFLFALGYTYLKDGHVRIDVFWMRYAPRTKRWLETFAIVAFLIPFCLVAIEFGAKYALSAYGSGEGSASGMGLPHRWIVKSLLPIGLGLFALAALAKLVDIWAKRWPPPADGMTAATDASQREGRRDG